MSPLRCGNECREADKYELRAYARRKFREKLLELRSQGPRLTVSQPPGACNLQLCCGSRQFALAVGRQARPQKPSTDPLYGSTRAGLSLYARSHE